MSEPTWKKSTFSEQGDCVEVAQDSEGVRVRDSKDPDGPQLAFSPSEWRAFLRGVQAGQFEV